ncbi:MAG TPA: flagellar biosynthesis protein FlhF [Accumulibacter sp.]|nr:flagellar biosynthesis protein FlhF [Accumulibacter sp.]
MNVRKFIGATARDALRKVKETLGPDAIILSNRTIPGGVEIMAVAAREMETIVPAPTPLPVTASPEKQAPIVADTPAPDQRPLAAIDAVSPPAVLSAADRLRQPAAVPVRPPVPPSTRAGGAAPVARAAGATPTEKPATDAVPAALMTEIRSLRRIVEQQLAGFAWGESARAEPVKTEMLRQMLDAGFSPQFTRELLADLPRDLDAGHALAWVKGAADHSLMTLGSENDIVDRGGIYALIGPTGVGKTTTTAKLAARCVLRLGARKLALVTTDGYRIGAHEQLRIYGRILGVSVHLARDADDLRATLIDLQHTHMVLIDTMGMSQRDRLVNEQVAMFGESNVQPLLLLSATSRGETLDDVVRAYSGLKPAGCILTKVDEATGLASSLDVIIRQRLRLYYVSNGQRVPEDLHLPNRSYLLHRAFKDLPETSPHRLDGVEPGLLLASAENNAVSASGGLRG